MAEERYHTNSQWNKYEAALLVDACLCVNLGIAQKENTISKLSSRLRAKPISEGIPIQDSYRNEAGIFFQMQAMNYFLSNGDNGMSGGSKLFQEVADLYKNERLSFRDLLFEARVKYPEPLSPTPLVKEEIEEKLEEKEICAPAYPHGKNDIFKDQVIEILSKKFPKGYRLNSQIDVTKFRIAYKNIFCKDCAHPDNKITSTIQAVSFVYNGKAYLLDILPHEIRTRLLQYINAEFSKGHDTLYYDVIYETFKPDFLDFCMYDADMLKHYLQHICPYGWSFKKAYFTKEEKTTATIEEIVSSTYINVGRPLSDEELISALYFLPQEKIRYAKDRLNTIISNGRGNSFHINIFHLNENQKREISNIIKKIISEKKYISEREILTIIQSQFPDVLSDNASLSDVGIRNALAYIYKDMFRFDGKIISSTADAFDMSEVFRDYSRTRSSFSAEELQNLANELGTQIYFDAIYEYSVRVSHNEYVSKTDIEFDIDGVDRIIDILCPGEFISIKDVISYGTFPNTGHKWNNYLLESYVYAFSRRYTLIHTFFNSNYTMGGIVKKSSHISSFDELIAHDLADSNTRLDREDALSYLVNRGYIVKKTYARIEQVLIMARTLRNKK